MNKELETVEMPNQILSKPHPRGSGYTYNSHSWQLDGWYLSDGTSILGPLSSREAFKSHLADASHTSLHTYNLVTRTGFNYWYPKDQLIELYNHLKGDTHKTIPWAQEKVLQSVLCKKDKDLPSIDKPSQPAKIQQPSTLSPEDQQHQQQPQENIPQTRPSPPVSLQPSLQPQRANPSSGMTSAQKMPRIDRYYLEELYMLHGGSLRLGKPTSSQQVFLSSVITLGMGCIMTAVRIKREILWHTGEETYKQSSYQYSANIRASSSASASLNLLQKIQRVTAKYVNIISNVGYALPVVSALHYSSLSRNIRKLETQNGYSYCSASLAMVLSFFPPLAASYLQRCINQHWNYRLYKRASEQK